MQLTIPIYVETRRDGQAVRQRHTVRPLFFPLPVRTDESLGRAMGKLTQEVTRELMRLGAEARHDALAEYTFSPTLEQHRLELRLELRKWVVRGKFFVVTFRALGRRVGYFPNVPDVWFECRRGEQLEHRAQAALTSHFRRVEKDEGDDFEFPEQAKLGRSAYVTPLEIDLQFTQKLPQPPQQLFAMLGGGEKVDGGSELQRVGRCLNWLYPAELDRALRRDAEVQQLADLLQTEDQRPVLIVGPRLVGKTAIVHEHVYRATDRRGSAYIGRENVWLLSPQRLVSGMSYVGQWEYRLLAILKNARKRRHVLYFDDFLGLYQAGISANSDLNMAQVLRPYIERRYCRFLVEMTPEVLRVFRERDRGLADQFHVLHVPEPNDAENLRIQLGVSRLLERVHHCRFQLEVLPTVLDLERRFVRDGAFPGKAARFLEQLAVQSPRAEVDRNRVLSEFRSRTGLTLEFIDQRQQFDRAKLVASLTRRVIGQPAAVDAIADVLGIARARLNEPDRPLASLLFLGPTGVGKTQCARATAEYLFGDPERVIRFDMNEFVEPGAAARLIGTFAHPEGLLTSAVRRQPFGVVLFDEIEKAYPEVFDLLLQVLGEGRLTDSLGRTTDFSNTLIILTSNLGVRDAAGRLGFGDTNRPDPRVFTRAAEKFFRPEFFNRLDRIVPFNPLGRDEIRQISRLAIEDVLSREGLARRKCCLRIDDETLDRVAESGFSAQYGARALKRSIERQLTHPVAVRLASLRPSALAVLTLHSGERGIEVDLQGLVDADPVPGSVAMLDLRDTDAVLGSVHAAIERIAETTAAWRPTGPLGTSELGPQHHRYYAVREVLHELRATLEQTLDARKASKRDLRASGIHPPSRVRPDHEWKPRHIFDAGAVQDIRDYLSEVQRVPAKNGDEEETVLALLGRLALLHTLATSHETADEVLMYFAAPDATRGMSAEILATQFAAALGEPLLLEATLLPRAEQESIALVLVRGPHAARIADSESGTHLLLHRRQEFTPVRVGAVPLPAVPDARAWFWAQTELRALYAWGPVLRVQVESGNVTDLRTGSVTPFPLATAQLQKLILSALPLPLES